MGFSPVFVREAEVGAFASAFWRVLTALPVLWIWVRIQNRSKKVSAGFSISKHAAFAGLMFSGDLIFWHLAILNTTMANATFMVCLAPVWVILFSGFLIDEKVERRAIGSLVVCLAGLALLINSSIQIDTTRLIGDIYGLITSIFLGLYFIAMRAGRRTENGSTLFLNSTLITCMVLFLAAMISGDALLPETLRGWGALFSLGILTHAGGQGLVTLAMGILTAMFSSLVIFLEAVAAAFFGWLIFDEKLSALQIIGGGLILSGVWFARPSGK